MNLRAAAALFGKEMLSQARSRRLPAALLALLSIGVASPLMARFAPGLLERMAAGVGVGFQPPQPTWRDAMGHYAKYISQAGLFLLVLLSMGSVAAEKQRGTAAFLLSKPVPRSLFLAVKLASSWAVAALAMVPSALGCAACTLLLFSGLPLPHFLSLNLCLLLYLCSVLSLTLCCSTIGGNRAAAGALSFLAWFLLAGLAAIPGFGEFLPPRLAEAGLASVSGAVSWKPFVGAGLLIASSLAAAAASLRRWEP